MKNNQSDRPVNQPPQTGAKNALHPAKKLGENPSESLGEKVGLMGILLVCARFLIRIMGLFSTLILARLLLPDDFAYVAIAMSFIAIAQGMTSFHVTHALIYLQDTKDQDWSTAFTLEAIRGLLLALFLYFIGPVILDLLALSFYSYSLQWLAALPLITGLANPKFQLFYKELNLKYEFIISLLSKGASIVLTITLAYYWQSYHALIVGTLFSSLIMTVSSYIVRPFWPRLTLKSFKRLFNFSGWTMGAGAINVIGNNLDQFLVAGFLGTRTTGHYRMAQELVKVPIHQLAAPLAQGLFPAFTQITNDRDRLRVAFNKALGLLTLLTLPVCFGLALTAHDSVPLLLGDNWSDVELILQILAPFEAFTLIIITVNSLILATGNTKTLFIRAVLLNSVRIPLLIGGVITYGLIGLLVAHALSSLYLAGLNFKTAQKFINFGLFTYYRSTWRSWTAALIMVLVVTISQWWYGLSLEQTSPDMIRLVLSVIAGSVSYIASHIILWWISGRPQGASAEASLMTAAKPFLKRVFRRQQQPVC